ncbi:rRNA maturation RNase YbeY [Rhodobacteraceae bacterium CCMM004]|nr:rRNA maturation RNase YbeY [Rhodobacteraceae bacterium CCMM004]
MRIETLAEDPRWTAAGLDAVAERAARAALAARAGPGSWEVAVLGCDDARIAALNIDFRGREGPTNVLSWPSAERAAAEPGTDPAPPDPADPELGDIAIAYETCRDEAAAADLALADHVAHLIVHAVLHLLGYDHEDAADGDLMERREAEILASLGLPDPYRRNRRGTDRGDLERDDGRDGRGPF